MFEKIKIIKRTRIKDCYDIEMQNVGFGNKPMPDIKSNYVANGIVCKNSGGDARASQSLQDTFEEFKEAKEFQNKYPLASRIAIKLEGNIRNCGSHAAAMVVSDKEISKYAPINKIGGIVCIEWRKELVEDMKLVKFDILGLKTLTIIQDAIKSAGAELPKTFNDPKVYESVFKDGNTNGVFQFSGTGIQKFIRGLNIKTFPELSDATTLYRPGALHCLFKDTLVDTQTRKKRICDLKVTDKIKCYIIDGNESRMEYKTPIRFGKTGNKEVFEIKTEDGKIMATAEHRFLTRDGYKKVENLEDTDEIIMIMSFSKNSFKKRNKLWNEEVKYSKIKSIKKIGIRETWDIEMPEPNNYIANKFVVHNSGQASIYANRKAGEEETTYMHPMLEPITKDTFGCILYQEQIMHIMNKVGAMSWATAEMCRKVITKSKGKNEFEKLRAEFVENAVKINGFDKTEAERLYDTVSMFGSYCISGETTILVKRKDEMAMSRIKIKDLFKRKKEFDAIFIFDSKNKKTKSVKPFEVTYSGKKKTYTLVCKNNRVRKIRATAEHKFMTPDGWKKLKELRKGDKVMLKQPSTILYGKDNPSFGLCLKSPGAKKGFIHDEFTKKTLSDSALKREVHGHTGFIHSEETKSFLRKNTLKMIKDGKFKQTMTLPHRIIKELLISENLNDGFESEYNFKNTFSIDEANPKLKIAIEVQGDYWHANPKFYTKRNQTQGRNVGRGVIKKRALEKDGWIVITLWENDIYNEPEECIESIKKEINDSLENPWGYEKIEMIFPNEIEDVYDISVDDPEHNFIANMFVTHNSFNKTHAYGYSMISYYCAWLKHYYPQHFFKALLKFETDATEIKKFMKDAKVNNIEIRYPDINVSELSYCIDDKHIYAGLNSIGGLGIKTAEKIIVNKPYLSFEDFKKRIKPSVRILKGLIAADAFREFNINKKEEMMLLDKEGVKKKNPNQKLFAEPKEKISDYSEKEWSQLVYEFTNLIPKISLEKSYDFGPFEYRKITELKDYDTQNVFVRGLITDVLKKDKILRVDDRHKHKFERRLLYLNLSDDLGNIACQINPETFEKYRDMLEDVKKKPVIVYGKVVSGGNKIIVDMMEVIDGEKETTQLREIFRTHRLLGEGKSYIVSAKPAVSKAGNSYYRVRLANQIEGLCFKVPVKLFPGQKISYSSSKEPFLDIKLLD